MRQFISILLLLLLLSNTAFAQSNEKFLSSFLLEDQLDTFNVLNKYVHFDFSDLWSQTKNYRVYGIIGTDHQRIKIILLTIKKNSKSPYQYTVSGKSNVKGTICDFTGTINLTEIKQCKELHFGVDNKYKDKGLKSQGILIADYEFKEDIHQYHSGVFKGKLYSKWYLNSENQLKYDNIQSISDEYMNNAYIGIWKEHSSRNEKICNWADFRVPLANQDFDVGAGEFSPSEKYYKNGWENYINAWLYNNQAAKDEEFKEWWMNIR